MRNWKPEIVIAVLFLALSLTLAGCSLTGSGGDPYSAGQKARTEVDQATEKAGNFVAGFCSATPLPIAALGLVVVLRRAKKDR
jgi:predicted small secreted protein